MRNTRVHDFETMTARRRKPGVHHPRELGRAASAKASTNQRPSWWTRPP